MSDLKRRLVAVEGKLLPPPPVEMLGAYETHYTQGWPGCRDYPNVEAVQCTEHGPTCAVVVTRISAPIRRIIVLEGAGAGPWLKMG